jgi:hypothetical protein
MLGTRQERTIAELDSLGLSLAKINIREQLKASEVENILEELKACAEKEDSERLLACLRLARNLVGVAHTNADLAVQFFSSSFDLWVGAVNFLCFRTVCIGSFVSEYFLSLFVVRQWYAGISPYGIQTFLLVATFLTLNNGS